MVGSVPTSPVRADGTVGARRRNSKCDGRRMKQAGTQREASEFLTDNPVRSR